MTFTPLQNKLGNELWSYSSFAGAACCIVVLLIIGILHLRPESRNLLDRVSFRLMTWSLVANMIFCLFSGSIGLAHGQSWGCRISVWIIILTLHISTFLAFCIALNLHLVIVHDQNGRSAEKYYYISSVCLAMLLTLPPFIAMQYGWDEVTGGCWYAKRESMANRIKWQVATQLFWSIACSFGELVAFTTVFSRMVHRHRAFNRADSVSQHGHRHHTITYRGIIIRIALYPLASFVLNSITIACDLHNTVASNSNAPATPTTYRLRLLNDFCYGGRGVVYAVLGITDPLEALIRAAKRLYEVYSTIRTVKDSEIPMNDLNPKLATIDSKDSAEVIFRTTEVQSHSGDETRRSHILAESEDILTVRVDAPARPDSAMISTEPTVDEEGIFIGSSTTETVSEGDTSTNSFVRHI
ncbi:hypothetical protein CYLTODRAFT_492048 [Cylindrobasidium torrendii FP15055 ss-10]|uniref:G-protein coupled receptors family 2 profile 2 domain-containing protein n=1 Tax=Cylindrobasidium torrendii FP15055 ss-10 TaxID=1314674 RepID=A0A0D7B6C6_9AGAR|nr:hypothetical protein CYLTODRAFT_492048 [Cylindrobasidium torrendii FP15055 ss-10]